MTKQSGPGKAYRAGMSLIEMFESFPDEHSARTWFEDIRWPDGERACPRCASDKTRATKTGKPMPYWCSDCRSYFSVKTGSIMDSSNITLRKWAIGFYIMATSLKGVSSMKLHRDLGITQKSAWHMAHRIRTVWETDGDLFDGPVEVDETYIGGKEANKHADKKLNAGRGAVGKTAVIGMKDRKTNKVKAAVVESTDASTLQGFVHMNTGFDAQVYTDEHGSYRGINRKHEAVKHSVSEYVDGMAHTNGIESHWALLKRGYVGEFEGRHNQRPMDTEVQMVSMAAHSVGKVLRYRELTG